MFDITNPIFADADKAREYLEAQRWPNGPVCPHCGAENDATKLKGRSTRPGVYKCKDCRKPFSVTVGTVMERSKIPLNKWMFATFLMASSKKGVSAHQIHRMLGITYKSAWFLAHRIREAMGLKPEQTGPIGGENKVVESDETYVGGKARNAHKGKPIPKKHAVMTLVERDGTVRATHVPNVTAKTVGAHLEINVHAKSHLMTDDSNVYISAGKKFAGHSPVNHSADQYVRLGGFAHVNTAESFHSLVKRGIYGTFHAVSEQHLSRYISEAAFKWNTRMKLGFNDVDRANAALRGIGGKRLTYRRTDEATHA
ncbi:MAG: IS1595 family transposase [Rhodomicrobium sp.]|nr:IS1595 family transposase [Rhodomicrobium sp.]